MSAGGGHGGGHKKKKHDHEEHENHERWLVSYADMMTLLMVLFIVMFAISQVDQKKFAQLKNGLAVGFGEESAAFQGSNGSLDDNGQMPAPMSLSPPRIEGQPKSGAQQRLESAAVAAADRARASGDAKAAEKEAHKLEDARKKIEEALKKLGQQKHVKFRIDERGLVVSVVSSEVIFRGDQADLLPGGQRVLGLIGPVLAKVPNAIEVDGHTNHLGSGNPQYPTSWELSTARASRVVRFLVDRRYVAAKRVTAAGFGAERPLYPVGDPRAIKLNRRVDIIILSSLPSHQRALLPIAAGQHASSATTTAKQGTTHD